MDMDVVGTDIAARDGTRLRVWESIPDGAEEAVLFFHGAITSSRALLAPPIEDKSYAWMHNVTGRGQAAFALDVRGYGESERPAELNEPAENNSPVVRATQAARDAADALAYVSEQFDRVHLVSVSWGTVYTGLLLTGEPPGVNVKERCASVTLCAPVYEPPWEFDAMAKSMGLPQEFDAYYLRDKETVRSMQTGPDELFDAVWAAQAGSEQGVDDQHFLVPAGAQVDMREATEGNPAYDMDDVLAPPTLIIRGSVDPASAREDAQNIYDNIAASGYKEYTELSNSGHYVMYGPHRQRLYDLVHFFQQDVNGGR